MILLRANAELRTVFNRLIKTMGVNVTWKDVFVILNNYLILAGNVRSLFFNFDNKKALTNVIEIPMEEGSILDIGEYTDVTNVLNMTLYAFGKWGAINGLKVEKDYAHLNILFGEILKELKIEPGYQDNHFRFYKQGVQITYEEVVQAAIVEGKRKEEGLKEVEKEEQTEEHRLGLWHKVNWVTHTCSFDKEALGKEDKIKSRIGNNFYQVGYKCPICGEKLYMVIYPEQQEFLIETDEGRVYLARAYTCHACSIYYTPRPGKLLGEGEVYFLDFGEEREAYEDYLELLGSKGDKTSNYKFNEYESERNKKQDDNQEPLEKVCKELDDMGAEELLALEDKLEDGFYPIEAYEKYHDKIKDRLAYREIRKDKESPEKSSIGVENFHKREQEESSSRRFKTPSVKTEKTKTERAKTEKIETEKVEIEKDSLQNKTGDTQKPEKSQSKEKYDARMAVIERFSPRQLKELKKQVQLEQVLSESEKKEYLDKIDQYLYQSQEKEMDHRVKACEGKSYIQIVRTMEEIQEADCPPQMKQTQLHILQEMKQQRGQKEAKELLEKMPARMSRKQFQLFQKKLEGYEDFDISPYEEMLKQRRELAEKQEIELLVSRVSKKDRNALEQLSQKLKNQDYAKENIAPVLKELHEKIKVLDAEAIDKLCPNITGMTFEEGLKAYDKIKDGAFLPELKTDALEMLDKRLTKIKVDECELLVRKLQDEMPERLKNNSRLYYYEARKAMRKEWVGKEMEIVTQALETYANERGKYEFPVLICDAARRENGKEGFVLTPDHLFYNSMFSSEEFNITDIRGIEERTGLLNKGIYVNQRNGVNTKIPTGLNARDYGAFAEVLDGFIGYLQEKPESRNIAYLAKESHEVKCCYRCGYTYKGGNICPQCGHKANN